MEQYMRLAIEEARVSLCEGNNGFGAVIVRDGIVIAASHDKEDTQNDPTSHAEINVIREASKKIGKKLSGCTLVCTHEPCPMCAFAIVWSGIDSIAYGYSIKESILQGRKRIDFSCAEAFGRAGASVKVYAGILKNECAILYREDVRKEIERLRDADDVALAALNEDSVKRRTEWFQEQKPGFTFIDGDLLNSGYRLLLERFGVASGEMPIVKKTDTEIVFHSMNFCPTLEACKILGLDTRHVCKNLNENSTDRLLKEIDGRLSFARNYNKLRPYSAYCEETISISKD
jgi:tRNA(Arg) A34 adenosine deaminase TadA